MDNFSVLPEGCISQILSMTSPRDASRSSAVSSLFHAAADSDTVWEKFLPSDYRQIITRSVSHVAFSTKKQLFLSLCDSPLFLDGGNLSFKLDRESGKKCYIISARELAIAWKEDRRYWKWVSMPLSRFSGVALLVHVWWLDMWHRMATAMLSPSTTYTAYLIYKIENQRHITLASLPLKASVRFIEGEDDEYEDSNSSTGFLALRTSRPVCLPQMRNDCWMEIELGEFYNDKRDDREVEMRLREVSSLKFGLIVEGIELRPKVGV